MTLLEFFKAPLREHLTEPKNLLKNPLSELKGAQESLEELLLRGPKGGAVLGLGLYRVWSSTILVGKGPLYNGTRF